MRIGERKVKTKRWWIVDLYQGCKITLIYSCTVRLKVIWD